MRQISPDTETASANQIFLRTLACTLIDLARRGWKANPLSVCALMCAFVVLIYWTLNLSGFCFRQFRYLSDNEKIRMAIERLPCFNPSPASRPRTREVVLSDKEYNHYSQVLRTYNSVEDFMQKNPNCCALVPKQEHFSEDFIYPTLWDKITGAYDYGIRYRYKWRELITPIDKNGNEGVQFVKEMEHTYGVAFDNCGNVWKKTHD